MPRYTMEIDKSLHEYFTKLAKEHRTTFADLLGRGIKAVALIRQQRERGLSHFGFVSDPSKLNVELRGLFPEQPHLVPTN